MPVVDLDTDVEFDPVQCAQLHNQLLAKATSHIPGASEQMRQDVLSSWLALDPEARPTEIPEDSPLYTFLSLIYRYEPNTIPFTPEFLQPIPEWFDNEYFQEDPDDEDRSFILLYPESGMDSGMDYGLWFDVDSSLVIWSGWRQSWQKPGSPFPPDEEWVPLEFVLKKALKMWDMDKFYWSTDHNDASVLIMRRWIPSDLDNAIEQWNLLLQAIQEKLPNPESSTQIHLQDPLPWDLVDQYNLTSFAKAFLCAAKRPSFCYVGPGITTFTPESFAKIYGSEPPDSNRLNGEDEEHYPCLLLPAQSGPVPQVDLGSHRGKESGFRCHLMVSEWSGLYMFAMSHKMTGDCTTVVTGEGIFDTIRWATPRPWGRSTGNLPLSGMLWLWTEMVKTGAWTVDSEGVSTKDDWFWDPNTEDERRVLWSKDCF